MIAIIAVTKRQQNDTKMTPKRHHNERLIAMIAAIASYQEMYKILF